LEIKGLFTISETQFVIYYTNINPQLWTYNYNSKKLSNKPIYNIDIVVKLDNPNILLFAGFDSKKNKFLIKLNLVNGKTIKYKLEDGYPFSSSIISTDLSDIIYINNKIIINFIFNHDQKIIIYNDTELKLLSILVILKHGFIKKA